MEIMIILIILIHFLRDYAVSSMIVSEEHIVTVNVKIDDEHIVEPLTILFII